MMSILLVACGLVIGVVLGFLTCAVLIIVRGGAALDAADQERCGR